MLSPSLSLFVDAKMRFFMIESAECDLFCASCLRSVMVLDLCNDAELSYQIWKYCGLTEDLTRFYVSEIVSSLELSV